MKLTFTKMLALGAASLLTVSIAQAGTVITEQDGSGSSTPSVWTSNFNTTNDLLDGLAASSSTGEFANEAPSGGLSVMTDGLLPAINDISIFATVGDNGGGGGTQAIYTFGSAVNLTDVQLYGGWVNFGRADVNTTVSYSTDGGSTYTLLGTENKDNGGGGPVAFFVNFADDTTTYIGSNANITNLKFDFGPGLNGNGYQGMAEIVAHGVAATPEPSTIALGLSGALVLGLCMFRRRLA